jgi:uncharacterized protein
VTLVTRRVAERFATEFGFTVDSALAPPLRQLPLPPQRPIGVTGGIDFGTILFLFILAMVIMRSFGGRRGRRSGCGGGGCLPIFIPMGGSGGWGGSRGGGWGGGGGGFGGFGGFGGGGGFSGGGGGSSW